MGKPAGGAERGEEKSPFFGKTPKLRWSRELAYKWYGSGQVTQRGGWSSVWWASESPPRASSMRCLLGFFTGVLSFLQALLKATVTAGVWHPLRKPQPTDLSSPVWRWYSPILKGLWWMGPCSRQPLVGKWQFSSSQMHHRIHAWSRNFTNITLSSSHSCHLPLS